MMTNTRIMDMDTISVTNSELYVDSSNDSNVSNMNNTDEVQIYIHGAETHIHDDANSNYDNDHLLEYHTEAAVETLNLLLPETQPTAAVDCSNFIDFDEFNLCLNNMFSDDEVVNDLDVQLNTHTSTQQQQQQDLNHHNHKQVLHFADDIYDESDSDNSLRCQVTTSSPPLSSSIETTATAAAATTNTTTILADVIDNTNNVVLDVINCDTRNIVNIFQ